MRTIILNFAFFVFTSIASAAGAFIACKTKVDFLEEKLNYLIQKFDSHIDMHINQNKPN
ncbi:MAG: hypothetical protein JSW62_04735 [Thermoplasmatales archaeon]|nr:MAG: hypothetical protein JSW62_04735 [Thermoplasmatales archaeon]